MMDFQNKKIGIFGSNGSGKTFFAKRLLQAFKCPMAYRITSDFDNEAPNVVVFKPTDKYADLDLFLHTARSWAHAKKIDCAVLDEFDLFAQRTLQPGSILNEMSILQRHDGLSLIFISRRPQDIPSQVMEGLHHIFTFPIEGPNVNKKFHDLHADYDRLLPCLDFQRHNFIYKEMMKPPILCSPV